jgi:hypothetical protein
VPGRGRRGRESVLFLTRFVPPLFFAVTQHRYMRARFFGFALLEAFVLSHMSDQLDFTAVLLVVMLSRLNAVRNQVTCCSCVLSMPAMQTFTKKWHGCPSQGGGPICAFEGRVRR